VGGGLYGENLTASNLRLGHSGRWVNSDESLIERRGNAFVDLLFVV